MMDDLIALFLLRANIAAAVAILVVLAVRRPVRQLIGPEMAYYLWALVPVAALTSLFPSLADFITPIDDHIVDAGLALPGETGRLASALAGYLALYMAGAAALLGGLRPCSFALNRRLNLAMSVRRPMTLQSPATAA